MLNFLKTPRVNGNKQLRSEKFRENDNNKNDKPKRKGEKVYRKINKKLRGQTRDFKFLISFSVQFSFFFFFLKLS